MALEDSQLVGVVWRNRAQPPSLVGQNNLSSTILLVRQEIRELKQSSEFTDLEARLANFLMQQQIRERKQ